MPDPTAEQTVPPNCDMKACTLPRPWSWPVTLLVALVLGGCATRVVDVRTEQVDPDAGYRIELALEHQAHNDPETLLLLAFSGGGTRAAAFSYGVLEALRETPATIAGRRGRLLDQVDAISGVSGGSFTALGYGLYGDRLFEVYEPQFLKRDVQGELIGDVFNPGNWPALLFGGDNRSDLAARYYDRILFHGATYADLKRPGSPLVIVSATDFSTGSRFTFTQGNFDLICADLARLQLAVAATASSAVPVAFAPVTLRNWGGTCGLELPEWIGDHSALNPGNALSLRQRLAEITALQDSATWPWLHLVDGGISDNLGLRAFIDLLEAIQVREDVRRQLGLGRVRRVVLIVVNALSSSPPQWGRSPIGPGILDAILQATSVPIDRNSMDSILLMQAMIERWKLQDEIRALEARLDHATPPTAPIAFFPIVIDFDAIPEPAERNFFNALPTTFALPDDTVDRLRAIAGTLLRSNATFQRLLRSLDASRPPERANPAPTGAGP
jgi:NTE family protein